MSSTCRRCFRNCRTQGESGSKRKRVAEISLSFSHCGNSGSVKARTETTEGFVV
jgi:hypothetical protein